MNPTYILDIAVGLRVGLAQAHTYSYGKIIAVTERTLSVQEDGGSVRRFSRHSLREIGSRGHKFLKPYVCTIAEAEDRSRARRAADQRARERMENGTSPDWSVIKGMSF